MLAWRRSANATRSQDRRSDTGQERPSVRLRRVRLYLYTGRAAFFTPGSEESGYPLGQALLAIGALLFGIAFGGMHKRLRGRPDDVVNVWAEFRALLRSGEFACSVLVAPIVFCGVYIAIKQQPDQVIAFLFAFQNGFFWDQIFARAKPPAEAPPKSGTSTAGDSSSS